jgi:hypothetical protein
MAATPPFYEKSFVDNDSLPNSGSTGIEKLFNPISGLLGGTSVEKNNTGLFSHINLFDQEDCFVLRLHEPPDLATLTKNLPANVADKSGIPLPDSIGGFDTTPYKEWVKSGNSAVGDYLSGATGDADKETRQAVLGNKYGSGKVIEVRLPLPLDLIDHLSHTLDGVNLNPFFGVIENMFGSNIGSSGKNILGSVVDKIAGFVGPFAQSAGGAAAVSLRKTLNPATEIMYRYPNLREWNFNFILMPKSRAEAEKMMKTLHTIKSHSLPISYINRFVYDFPGTVDFEFGGRFKDKLFKNLVPCMIKDIQFAFSTNGVYAHFSDENVKYDGVSTMVQVSLVLTETSLISRNQLEEEYSKGVYGQ